MHPVKATRLPYPTRTSYCSSSVDVVYSEEGHLQDCQNERSHLLDFKVQSYIIRWSRHREVTDLVSIRPRKYINLCRALVYAGVAITNKHFKWIEIECKLIDRRFNPDIGQQTFVSKEKF